MTIAGGADAGDEEDGKKVDAGEGLELPVRGADVQDVQLEGQSGAGSTTTVAVVDDQGEAETV